MDHRLQDLGAGNAYNIIKKHTIEKTRLAIKYTV